MPWTMIAVSIGAQYFNNWQANKKTEELQLRQREFQKALQNREFERMRTLQRESAQLQLEIDAELHKQRLNDIYANYDEATERLSRDIALDSWPLKVLPFVMRGQSFGTLFNGTKSIALHCILTPSNCDCFNERVYTDIDMRVETICNKYWSSLTSHPVAYYGGSWKMNKRFNLDQVELLRTQLDNVPTVIITPYFVPELCFKVRFWGMGKEGDLTIKVPEDIFSYKYKKGMNYSPKDEYPKGDLIETTIDEFVEYIQCLIGYVADIYYWGLYRVTPALPHYIKDNVSVHNPTLLMSYHSGYADKLEEDMSMNSVTSISDIEHYLNYIESIRELGGTPQMNEMEDCLVKHVHKTYIPTHNSTQIPESYKDFFVFKNNEATSMDTVEWVSKDEIESIISVYEERLDLVDYLRKFQTFILEHANISDITSTCIYIEHENFIDFRLHVYNIDLQKFLNIPNGFNYQITTKRPYYLKKIQSLFKHMYSGHIVCRHHKIDKLINDLISQNSLTF